MKLYEICLELESPFMTPWQSDILFGHLAWAYRDLFGEKALLDWLVKFQDAPLFVLSDGFIQGSFPRPLFPPPERQEQSKKEKIENIKRGKRLKNLKLIHERDFYAFLQGNPISFSNEVEGTYKSVIQVHNTISRDSGRSLDTDGLFEEESTLLKGTNRISIFVRVQNENNLELLQKLMLYISLTGYGRKKNLGYGQFKVIDIFERFDLDTMSHGADAVVWLSYGVPSKEDPISGWYKLETKYGKLGGRISESENLFKKPLTRIIPGSIFVTTEPKPYYGRMLNNISFNKDVVQYAYALALPVKLPNYL
ncbi:hypothetical protein NKR74_11010 [Bacillus sp. 3103sda1]|uniref:type III-A CRISPR-associated RAMP protein Csm4 n=1 Tax=Bacillus sp. 3103sda1 TaxID=2953808 RepID=UPI0020A1E597|nr:hypothetical protein [Bacillus sp. 3103sda1]MCP1123842.1 hypothetical protein [Bacillus sp. 3103sda1]